jgi:hypothetical protein
MRAWIFCTRWRAFLQSVFSHFFRLKGCCALRSAASCRLKLGNGQGYQPLVREENAVSPRSIERIAH